MSDLIGKSVGSYRILEQVGVGGMATIYKAYQPSMDRYVAIKVLPHYLAKDEQFLQRFQREAHAIAKLEHPHILPVFDYGEQDGITYIAMRYVEAGTLKEHMAQTNMSLAEISRIIAQVSGALDYAHKHGIIHRDVKPGNVLIDSQGNTYLTDFGLARIMETSQQFTASGVSVGTPAYMSPEQGKGIKVDHRSDIYALGVMLYEMVTGRVPYEAETPLAVLLKHITDPLPLPRQVKPDIPEPVELVILRALAKEPADRFQSAEALANGLETAVRHPPLSDDLPPTKAKITLPAASAVPADEPATQVTHTQQFWQTSIGKAVMIGGTAVILIVIAFLLGRRNQSEVVVTEGEGETATSAAFSADVTQPAATQPADPTAEPESTTAPTMLPANNLQLRFRMTSTSDWAELALLPGIDILNFATVETGGETTQAVMRDRIIDLDQDIEQAAEGHTIFIVQDMTLDASSTDEVRLAIDKGCIGVTTVEVYNVVTGTPLLLKRFANETCQTQIFSVSTGLLTTADIPSTPTNEPPGLREIYPIAPEKGQVVNWCDVISPPQLCTHDLATDEIAVITEDLNFMELGASAWSPDGQQIVFSAGENESGHDLFVINADGSDLRQLTDNTYSEHESEWSPNGEKIIFVRNCGLWSIRPDGSEEQLLMRSNDYCVETAGWSPNSEMIAFTAFRDGAVRDIWRINADGGQPQRIYDFGDQPPRSGGVVWLPDGERILSWFWIDGSDEEQRLLIYADGSGVAGTIGGVPYWWQRNYHPRWGIEGEVVETATSAALSAGVSPSPALANLTWEQVNDGSIFRRSASAIAVDPQNAGVMLSANSGSSYKGAGIGTGAGVFKSTDGGATWFPSSSGLGQTTLSDIIIDPVDPNIVYALSSSAVPYKSTNGGESWQMSSEGLPALGGDGEHVFVIDPNDHDKLILTDPWEGIFVSTDGAANWELLAQPCQWFLSLVIDPRDSNHLIGGSRGGEFGGGDSCPGIFHESTDGGRSWIPIDLGIAGTEDAWGGTLVSDPRNPDRLYLGLSQLYTNNVSPFLTSADGGKSWVELTTYPTDWWPTVIVVDPNDGSVYGGGEEKILYRSTDEGRSWSILHTFNDSITAMAFDNGGERLYVNATDIFRTDDDGQSWRSTESGLALTWLDLNIDPTSGVLFAEDGMYNLYRSTDAGATWETVDNAAFGLAFDRQNGWIYRESDGALFRSEDAGVTWTFTGASSPADAGPKHRIYINPQDANTFYSLNICCDPFIYRTTDGGQSWEPAQTLSHLGWGRMLVADDGQFLAAVGHQGGVDVSDDGGASWRSCRPDNRSLLGGRPPAAALHPQDNGTMLVGSWGGGVFKTSDGCGEWTAVNNGLQNLYINDLEFDLQTPNIVYAGTDDGAYISFDGGENWHSINNGLGDQPIVYSLAVDPMNPGQLLAVTPNGIYRLELGEETAVTPAKIIAHWPFDGNFTDNTGNGFDLQATGENIDFVSGCFGQAVHFNGDSDSYLTRGQDDDEFDFGSRDYVIALWVKYDQMFDDSDEQALIEKCAPDGGCGVDGWGLTTLEGGVLRFVQNPGPQEILDWPLPRGNWHHIAVVHRGNFVYLYHNGAQIVQAPAYDIMETDWPLIMGRRVDPDQLFPLVGAIDEVVIYEGALSAEEVQALALEGATCTE